MTRSDDVSRRLGRKVLVGTAWSTVERFGSLGLQFAVNLVLARLLTPAEFAYVGVLAFFMSVSYVLIDGGFATALIQKQNPTRADYSVIFIWNMAFALFFYALLFITAPLIALYVNMPLLEDIIKVFSLSLPLSALSQVQIIRLRKELAFGFMAVVNLGGYAAGGALGIWLAMRGAGPWSLVWMQVCNMAVCAVCYNLFPRWHPGFVFSRESFKQLFGYGGYLLMATVFQEACKNVQTLIIGRRFSPVQVGLYGQAHKLDQINSYAIPQVLVQVMFPFYSRIQSDKERLALVLGKCVRIIALFIFPLLTLLIIVAEPLIVFLFDEQWRDCAPYFRILCIGGLFTSLQNINFYAVAARGHSRVLFQWSFYKWGSLLVLLLCGMNFGMFGIMWAMAISNANIFVVNALLSSRYVGYPFGCQIRSLLPFVGACLLAAFVVMGVYFKNLYNNAETPGLWSMSVCFVAVYTIIVLVFRFRVLTDIRYIYQTVIKR